MTAVTSFIRPPFPLLAVTFKHRSFRRHAKMCRQRETGPAYVTDTFPGCGAAGLGAWAGRPGSERELGGAGAGVPVRGQIAAGLTVGLVTGIPVEPGVVAPVAAGAVRGWLVVHGVQGLVVGGWARVVDDRAVVRRGRGQVVGGGLGVAGAFGVTGALGVTGAFGVGGGA